MSETSSESFGRLRELWRAWGIRPDHAAGEGQPQTLAAVEDWLSTGEQDPEVPCRAAQLLLLDAAGTAPHRRLCWSSLQKRLEHSWPNVATDPRDVQFAQALVLAAWPEPVSKGWLWIASLFEGAWAAIARSDGYNNAIVDWRQRVLKMQASSRMPPPLEEDAQETDDEHLARLQEQCDRLSTEVKRLAAESNLLWWGQARYSRSQRVSLRRIRPMEDVLWWAAWEASGESMHVDVESAGAYLVETLHGLGHDVFEQRPLRQWMDQFYSSLQRNRARVPPPCARLRAIADNDALGLPVTWVRLRATNQDSLKDSEEQIALELDTPIDLGQWASWIFRECLLDRHLDQAQ